MNLDGLTSVKEARRLQSDCEVMGTRSLDDSIGFQQRCFRDKEFGSSIGHGISWTLMKDDLLQATGGAAQQREPAVLSYGTRP